jgi:hypothetical protein
MAASLRREDLGEGSEKAKNAWSKTESLTQVDRSGNPDDLGGPDHQRRRKREPALPLGKPVAESR